MFSIDLVTFFYKYPNCITVRQHTKNPSLRELLRMKNCVCVRDHDDVWFIAKKMIPIVKRTRWWTDMQMSNFKTKKYYLFMLFFYFFKCFSFQKKSPLSICTQKTKCEGIFMALIWHACMTCSIRWLHFGKANIINNLYVYMWFVMQISSKFARFRKQKRDSHKWNSRRCNFLRHNSLEVQFWSR